MRVFLAKNVKIHNRKEAPMAYIDDISQVWHLVRETFRPELSDVITDLWLGGLEVMDFQGSTVIMKAESEVKIRVVTSKYKTEIEKRFSEMLGFDVTLRLVCTDAPKIPNDESSILQQVSESFTPYSSASNKESANTEDFSPIQNTDNSFRPRGIGSTLPPFNFEYTFENFIVGSSNKFAHAACLAVADRPAQAYNPLFIYGPSGLGKTHLLYAITNELKKKIGNVRVIYIKGEDFTNQMIDSLSRQAMNEFRDKYRSCDVLLIDDIQFIAGKTSTQEEFFHTFNALHEAGKQIIMTSDRPPREIKTLEDRLKTRFEWGLIADIQPPDLELRTAIIKKKADQVSVSIPDDVLTFLAENLRSNIRQIEGAIKKLGAKSFLTGRHITMELARNCISELLGGAEPVTVTVDKIFAAVLKKYNIKREDIVSGKRTKDIANARHVTVYIIRSVTDMSLPNIGKIIARDHSTVLSSIEAVEKRMAQNPVFRAEIEEMVKEIKGS